MMGKFPVRRDAMGASCRQENVGEGVPIRRDAIGASYRQETIGERFPIEVTGCGASYRQETVGQGDFSTPLRSARNDGAA